MTNRYNCNLLPDKGQNESIEAGSLCSPDRMVTGRASTFFLLLALERRILS